MTGASARDCIGTRPEPRNRCVGPTIGAPTPKLPDTAWQQILCGWTAARLGMLSFHTRMEASDATDHLRDRIAGA